MRLSVSSSSAEHLKLQSRDKGKLVGPTEDKELLMMWLRLES